MSRHSMHPIIYRWMEREKMKTFLYFYKCDSPQSQWIKYEFISHSVHRSFFTRAMGGQIQKLFIGEDSRLKRFVIKFLAHSLVKVHMILHKKVSSWRIAKWKCLFDNTAWRCNNRIRRTSEVEVKKKLNCYSCTHDLEHKVTGIHLRMSQRKQCFTKMSILLLKWLKIIKKYEQSEFCLILNNSKLRFAKPFLPFWKLCKPF